MRQSREEIRAAEERAWAGRRQPERQGGGSDLVQTFRSLLLNAEQMREQPRAKALIDGVLFTNSLAWLWGPPGQGKTFLAMDWAAHLGTAREWQGRAVEGGSVLYVVAEGAGGFPDRIEAWEEYHGRPMAGVHFFHHPLQLHNDEQVAAFLVLVAQLKPVLVVIDTQSRCMAGQEENGSVPMTKMVEALDHIRIAADGACVLTLHHSERGGRNPRGFSAIDGAADTLVKATRSGKGPVTLTFTKQKDDDTSEPMKLPLVKAGKSLVVASPGCSAGDATTQSGCSADSSLSPWDSMGLSKLQHYIYEMLREDGKKKVEDLATSLGKHRTTINSAVNDLLRRGLVERDTPWIAAKSNAVNESGTVPA
ncbi:AAA family ATPase [Streptomyces sp. NPDC059443]|uniref:AAA family ATPase n=1 Tax=unclassified Streptomyces TaxID=2593676 RepID=UPI0036848F82